MVTERHRSGPVTLVLRGRTWHCEFQLAKRRVSRTTREPQLNTARAERVALEIYQTALLRSRGEEPEPTLREAFRLWEAAHVLRKSPGHVRNMERCGRIHLGQLGDLLLTELSTALVEDELNRFLANHQPSSANQWLTYLRIVCKWAIRRRMIRAMPFDVPEQKVKCKPKPMIPVARAEEWLAEVDALTIHDPGVGMVIRLMLGMGLRFGEAAGARWEWLALEREAYTPGLTKGGEAWARPVPPWILDDLVAKAVPFGWMCPTLKGAPVTPGRVARVVAAACDAVGLPRMTPHRLRATAATWWSEEGVPIQDIKEALGHKDVETTMVYLGVDMGRIAQAQRSVASKARLTSRKCAAGRG